MASLAAVNSEIGTLLYMLFTECIALSCLAVLSFRRVLLRCRSGLRFLVAVFMRSLMVSLQPCGSLLAMLLVERVLIS